MLITIGDFTFVEPEQADYEDLYQEYGVSSIDLNGDRPHFCIIHSISEEIPHTEENMNRVENEGLSYLIRELYSGIIIE